MNNANRQRIEYWVKECLSDTCKQLAEAVGNSDTEWVIRHLLSLSHDTYKMLQFATNTSQYDKYAVPKNRCDDERS